VTAEQRSKVAAAMNLLPFVRWDRFVTWSYEGGGTGLLVYGWVDREDGRSDFVTLQFESAWGWEPSECSATTSSASYSREIQRLLRGTDEGHNDCQRVDEHFGDLVDRKVVLA
jgi:hypothetical protein